MLPQIGTDNHEIRYEIVAGDPLKNFSIHSTRGEIFVNSPLDFESINMVGDDRYFNLTVKVKYSIYYWQNTIGENNKFSIHKSLLNKNMITSP